MPTDSGREKQKLRPLHGGETRGLGVPLIPANQHADFAEAGVPRAEPKVARCEIEFFVIQRVVRDVHFSINAKQRSVGIDDCCGIVIHAGAAFFKRETTITIPQRLAKRWNASVVAPGIDSARWKLSWSSLWQKYSVAKSSCVQTIFAPIAADCSTLARVAWRLVAGSLSALA